MKVTAIRRSSFLLVAALWWLGVLVSLPPLAQASGGLGSTVDFDIGPQRLTTAVLRYSEQSGVQVTSPAALLTGRHSTDPTRGWFQSCRMAIYPPDRYSVLAIDRISNHVKTVSIRN